METMVRKDPRFALCGLPCCLCPRFHADGASRCPGCGGEGFAEKHPTCAVASCNRRHDGVEYCFQCGSYPCGRYSADSDCDSFISYRSVRRNLELAKSDLAAFGEELARRYDILRRLLLECEDGRSKGLYCLVASDMPLGDLERLFAEADSLPAGADAREKAKTMRRLIEETGVRLGTEYRLRKKGA